MTRLEEKLAMAGTRRAARATRNAALFLMVVEMGSDFVISLFFFCGPRPNSFPTNYMIKCPGK